ncbi:hypothetical protein QMK33_19530 [Hymenobacter sp. H14-R3]|uniref:hypothetical protein n=1 Tax=Hymenobacter sp. H14-R3 TaxID=3046308 RepID=UPI0024B98559|nr:hypothetical protein [Hymenobacter sp. H14-R3]MDJ0367346.1 hypothetical protein [Hymenobacter sp. H14-R3]
MRELAATPCPEARALLAEVSVGLTVAQAAAAPKLFQLRHRLGETVLVKLLVVVLRAFVDSLRVPDKPDAADILELADNLAHTYTHDSLKDIILALKEARTSGTKFYQSLDVSTLYRLIQEYFTRKAAYLENRHLDQKAAGAGQQAQDVRLLGEAAPRMLDNVAQQIPPGHPNAETLRTALTITNGKARRGLLTPEEAQAQRANIRKATQRKPRPDWQPSPVAQRRIDQRNRAEDRAILEKYRRPTP